MHPVGFVHDLAVVLGVAAVTFVIARRLRQPAVLGYLLAGLIVGPYLPIPLFADPTRVHTLSEFGVVLVMFAIGLEFRLAKLIRVLPVSGITGLIQMGSLLWLGFAAGGAFGWGTVESLFLGASIAISSTMVVSSVFAERPVPADLRELVLGVLVLQDVAAIALIATMTVVADGGQLSAGDLGALLWRLSLVLLSLVVGGLFVVPRAVRMLVALGSHEALVVGATGICFAMAVLAESLGYSVALGAFIAGILVAESGHGDEVEHAIAPLKHVFSAVFFVSVGMTVDPRLAMQSLGPSLWVAFLVLVGQLVSVFLGALLSGNGIRRSLGAGLALGQIGEFAFIIAGIGVAAGVAPETLTPILVTVAVLTAFTTPVCIQAAPRLASALNRRLPERLRTALFVYEGWLEKLRETSQGTRAGDRRRRARRAVILDGIGLVVLAMVWRVERDAGVSWLTAQLGIGVGMAHLVVAGGALLASLAPLWGLFKNTDLLARLSAQQVLAGTSQDGTWTADSAAAEALLVGAFRISVLLGVGVPAAALLRPLFGAPYVASVVGLLLALVALGTWRSTKHLDRNVRSATEAMLAVVARQRTDVPLDPTESQEIAAAWFPGLDNTYRCRLAEGMPAVGETLAGLDLRASTGAAVLAIHRPGEEVLVPTGTEVLASGDLLVIAGTKAALDGARNLLMGPAVAESNASLTRV